MKKSIRRFGRTALLGAISAGMVLTTLVALAPTASAYRQDCINGEENTQIVSRTDYTEIDAGDSQTFSNESSSTHYNVKKNFTYTASTKATVSSSSTTTVNAGVAVEFFNAGAQYKTGSKDAMETGTITTQSFTTDFNVPPYTRIMEYVGHRVTRANMVHTTCSGGRIHIDWQGTVFGPRYAEAGIIDCKRTTLC